jgi:hypothetical protein
MENKDILFKPRDMYQKELKGKFHENAIEYFEELAKETKTDVELNTKHVNEYKKACDDLENAQKILGKKKRLKHFIVFLIVLCFIACGICALITAYGFTEHHYSSSNWYVPFALILGALVALGGAIGFILLIKKKINVAIKNQEGFVAEIEQRRDDALSSCYADMAALNASFDWNMPAIVMEKTTPILDLDPFFSIARAKYFEEKFNANLDEDENTSVVGLLSGNIQGNPFLLEKTFDCDYHSKKWDGSLTITWTTTSYDSKGNSYTKTHTQTLYASVYHDAPFYGGITKLLYGNEAAPHLSFSRDPSGASKMNAKEQEKFVAKKVKEIQKQADKAITSGSSFTRMGNDKFDVFFGGTDRDNEVEYRLLFTPLAQANELDLITNPEPFGDDFTFVKRNMMNLIISDHSQKFDYSTNPEFYTHYDYSISKAKFVGYCDDFIENLFFDLAPLISIPLYQMHKTHEYIYGQDFSSYLPNSEHEVMANHMDPSCFIPDKADPSLPLILKTSFIQKDGKSDRVNVHAYSYMTTEMIDYVPVKGGDGYFHDVPVHWIRYDRVDSDNVMELRSIGTKKEVQSSSNRTLSDFLKNIHGSNHFERNMLALFPGKGKGGLDDEISSLFSEDKQL